MEKSPSSTTDTSNDQKITRLSLHRGLIAGYTLLAGSYFITPVVAQDGDGGGGSVGSQICGTPIAETINELAPLVLAIVIFGGGILCYILHAYSGFKKDPNKKKEILDWRNRAGFTAVTAPLVGKFIEIAIAATGLGLAGCIDIIPMM